MQSRRLIHPHTGEPLKPIFTSEKTGRTYWPILGASEDDEKDDDLDKKDEDKGAGDDDAGGGGGTDKDDTRDPRIKELSDEAARHRNRAKNAETELEKAQRELKALQDRDKSELERTTGRVAELEEAVQAKEEALRTARLENAFLTSNKYTWQNPARALQLADLSEVEILDDGSVKGLDKALEALAKSDPYLLKEKDDDDGKNGKGKSGADFNGGRGSKEKTDREALEKKYPALRR